MSDILNQLMNWIPDRISDAIHNRFVRGPISSVSETEEFVQTRAAYVAQTSLFGYLKERMGRSYPKYFENDEYVASIRIAQIEIYRACAADLAIFAAAHVSSEGGLEPDEASALAQKLFIYAMRNSGREEQSDPADAIAAFGLRTGRTIWPNAALEENAFFESPRKLIEAAPVIDDFKETDSEIVMNSIRFRWRDIREQFRKRADGPAVCADYRSKEY